MPWSSSMATSGTVSVADGRRRRLRASSPVRPATGAVIAPASSSTTRSAIGPSAMPRATAGLSPRPSAPGTRSTVASGWISRWASSAARSSARAGSRIEDIVPRLPTRPSRKWLWTISSRRSRRCHSSADRSRTASRWTAQTVAPPSAAMTTMPAASIASGCGSTWAEATKATAVTTTVTAASTPAWAVRPSGRTRRRLVDDCLSESDGDSMRTGIRLQLREDMPYVALHRLLADEPLAGDVRVGHAVGQELEDLPLAGREHVLALLGEERGHERGVDVAVAACDLLDRPHQRLVGGLLQDVALGSGL